MDEIRRILFERRTRPGESRISDLMRVAETEGGAVTANVGKLRQLMNFEKPKIGGPQNWQEYADLVNTNLKQNFQTDPRDPGFRDAVKNMAMNFAPLGMVGKFGGMPKIPRSEVNRLADRMQKILNQSGIEYAVDASRVSPSQYFLIKQGDRTLKLRVSDHVDKYGAHMSISPSESAFDDAINWLRSEGFNVASRVRNTPARQIEKLFDEFNSAAYLGPRGGPNFQDSTNGRAAMDLINRVNKAKMNGVEPTVDDVKELRRLMFDEAPKIIGRE